MTLLEVTGLDAGHNGVPVVHLLDLAVDAGQIVALLGPNGAGKTTTIATLVGRIPALGGMITVAGEPLRGPMHRRARKGIAYISEERSIFAGMSTLANLQLGPGPVDRALELFPELEPLRHRRAGLLSGGEQQMLTLARALAGKPRLLFVDELSLGLAPLIVQRLLGQLQAAAARGVGILIVEQHAQQVLRMADQAYVLRRGKVALSGSGSELLARIGEVEDAYLRPAPAVGTPAPSEPERSSTS